MYYNKIMEKPEYTEATLCFLIKDNQVLLAEKQRKIGAGRLNGFGGRADPEDKDIYETNRREVLEEIGVEITNAKKVGEIAFHNPSDDDILKKMIVHIFIADKWVGEPKDTDEMKRIAWYEIDKLNYDLFLSADRLFIPQILNGQYLKGKIEYNPDWSVKISKITVINGF